MKSGKNTELKLGVMEENFQNQINFRNYINCHLKGNQPK